MTEEITQNFVEVNSPFTYKQVLEDRKVACDFIEWALLKYHRRLQDFPVLGKTHGNNNRNVNRPKILAQRASILGLCEATDSDLIEGKASHTRTICFYTTLLSMIKYMPCVCDDESKVSNESNLDEITKSSTLLDGLPSNPSALTLILSNEYDLFPKDIALLLSGGGRSKGGNTQNKNKVDILNQLQSLKEQRMKEVQHIEYELSNLKENDQNMYEFEEEKGKNKESLARFATVAGDLKQQLMRFGEIYDKEIAPWVKNNKDTREKSSTIGPSARRSNIEIKRLRSYLDDLQTIHTSYENIVSNIPDIVAARPLSPPNSNNTREIQESIKINPINIVNAKGETGLEAITKLETIEKVLRTGIVRRERSG
ncbi:10947_t:CDS:2 [Ambispora gerdemannii]|uniref:10947_t:CDS:1 n=1 Tax=Ambispora gerdemannii TaxID=144530 RepID=A0A9N9FJT0_9GLOM|nr:10947_t:CDS:2 [Ambispora gerdemannii]